jgi:hypothetical protein
VFVAEERRYVKAMGGEIEVIAVVKGKRIALHGVIAS